MRLNSELCINLNRLDYNLKSLKELAPNNEIIFMVKANAYGHGLLEIVEYAHTDHNISHFGVADIAEAIEIRKKLPHLKIDLFVFSSCISDLVQNKDDILDLNIVPVLHHKEQLELVLGDEDYKNLPLILKFNTGMNRLGLGVEDSKEVIGLLQKFGRLKIHHLMTHFANSYLKVKPTCRTTRQYETFVKLKKDFIEVGIEIENSSVSNSGAIIQGIGLEETHIRPGLMLYGPNPVMGTHSSWKGKTLSDFKTHILKIESVQKGTPVGYGSHPVSEAGYLVYLPLGYGDGILTYYSGQEFQLDGVSTKFIGRINMDISVLFFKELPSGFKNGKEIVFWGEGKNDITEFSSRVKTHQYQVFTAITNRVPRRYIK